MKNIMPVAPSALLVLFVTLLVNVSHGAEPAAAPAITRPSKCPAGCTKLGTCNEELGRCDCPRTHTGPDCSTPLDSRKLTILCHKLLFKDSEECTRDYSCLNACNMRGKCMAGWCHCQPGYYGADCSLSLDDAGKPQLLAGTSWQTRARRPWVYVYELPPEFTTWLNYKRLDRPTHNLFWQRLLSSGARTADGDKADWFFIPIRQRGMGDQTLLPKAIDYIRKNFPWWDKHGGGGRHFVIHTGDLGMREAGLSVMKAAENMTWLTHWGLHTYHKYSDWDAAHRVGKDVVIPVYVSFGHFKHFGMTATPLHPNYNHSAISRNQTFFFAGRICGDRKQPDTSKEWPYNCGHPRGYSAGVRQAVHHWHHNRTGWRVATYERRYDRQLSKSKFCLAPLGGGHGQRQIIVSFMGCVPVTIGDSVMQPFEPELDWTRFSLTVPQADIPRLHEVLGGVDEEQHASMKAALRCAAQHFAWSSLVGGFMHDTGAYDAFETTLEILRMKLKYPGVDPATYVKRDPEFADFVNCRSEGENKDAAKALCSMSKYDGRVPPCQSCVASHHGMVPGGAICCADPKRLAQCPRLWL
mmetsp:Transcript_36676/g.92646  ORF Transcript_36676/g.92646 Transcript_36676/m.92646 type:complete len:581 (-) Transcript_36676:360-2102(-)